MALIKCKNCGKEISNKASACPYCDYKNDKQVISLFSRISKKIILGIVIVILIIFVFIFVNSKKNNYIGKSYEYQTSYYANPKDIRVGYDLITNTIYFKSKDEIIYKKEYYYRNEEYKKTLKYELNKNELKIYNDTDDVEIYNYDKNSNCFIDIDNKGIEYCEKK